MIKNTLILVNKLLLVLVLAGFGLSAKAQVSSVTFGKNRIQYRKYDWRFYQTRNFNVHFNNGGLELAKYALQIAEEELPQLEAFTETALQRRANIVLYNSYEDMKATNIGLSDEVQDVGGLTKLVNNKLIIYFDGNHANLRKQIREGIASVLVQNRLFGENISEIAGNATLLDLPKWLTDGYIKYAAEPWSVEMDDATKNALLARDYRNFYQFAFQEPEIAGHAFWNFLATNYRKENVSYFFYLSILYKNLNAASQRITRKKFKDLLAEFMEKETDKYYEDIRGRRNYPRGSISITEDVDENRDFYHFAPNPNKRSYTYAVAEYVKGKYSVALYENYVNRKVLVKDGVRVLKHQRHPNYPLMTWDGKGSRLAVVYWQDDKVRLLVYDLLNADITVKTVLPFDQVQDAQYYVDNKTLILSAVRNGHTDIYLFEINTGKTTQITNDVWDDLDASFVSFPNKYGIIFASNRPNGEAAGSDTSLPSSNRFNIFLADIDDKGGFRQISQLTNLAYGDARFPTQYNTNHFTFVSSINGVGNRYAGFFTTKAEGLDTLLFVGDEILRNPTFKEIDSTLKVWERSEPDSIGFIAITEDSTYTFPLTNYQSSLLESRIAGDEGQVSEVTRQSDFKMLYRLRVDSTALRRRNISSKPTAYMKSVIDEGRRTQGNAQIYQPNKVDTTGKTNKTFIGEFTEEEKEKTAVEKAIGNVPDPRNQRRSALEDAKLYKYRLRFSNDLILGGVSNNIIINRYQPYAGGSGPIYPNNGNNLSWAFVASLSDVLEDYRITGGAKPGINFSDNEYFVSFQNFRKRLDWGFTYYRAANSALNFYPPSFTESQYSSKTFTSLYQANFSYPLSVVRSLRLITAFRNDRTVLRPNRQIGGGVLPDQFGLARPDTNMRFINTRFEYVYDNSLLKTLNIWNGLRYKFYIENITQLNKSQVKADEPEEGRRQMTFNFGADARYYLPLYRNFIWAVRGAFDVSWGNQKLIYYLGGTDGWISPQFNDENRPDPTQRYVYQTTALNLRGFNQNVANGNNAAVINSELRLPVFTTFFNKPINNAFIRNFQLVQFIDLGTAWTGGITDIRRPGLRYRASDANGQPDFNNPIVVDLRAGGIGPFAGGYGFGARSTLLGYFMRLDTAWPMNGFFSGKPQWYFSLGVDF